MRGLVRTCRWSQLGLRWPVRGRRRPPAALCRGCAAPARERERGVVGELQGEVVERFPGSVWAKGDRRWELRGSRATATMGCRGGSSPVAWGGGERVWEDQ